jgi:DNA-directed RNA polymerase specialized sigma24 family protein
MTRRNFSARLQEWKESRDHATDLPEISRMILQACYEEGKSLAEIAAVHHRSLSTIRHHHDYGLFLLRRLNSSGEQPNRLENSREKLLT